MPKNRNWANFKQIHFCCILQWNFRLPENCKKYKLFIYVTYIDEPSLENVSDALLAILGVPKRHYGFLKNRPTEGAASDPLLHIY